jgi:hypothetical protein
MSWPPSFDFMWFMTCLMGAALWMIACYAQSLEMKLQQMTRNRDSWQQRALEAEERNERRFR